MWLTSKIASVGNFLRQLKNSIYVKEIDDKVNRLILELTSY